MKVALEVLPLPLVALYLVHFCRIGRQYMFFKANQNSLLLEIQRETKMQVQSKIRAKLQNRYAKCSELCSTVH